MSEQELASHEWCKYYREVVNSDEERFIIEMNNRTVNDITPNPGLNQDWSFGVEDEGLPGAIRPEDIGVDLN